MAAPRFSEVLQNVLGRLGFTGSRFPGDNDGLGETRGLHIPVRLVGYSSRVECYRVECYRGAREDNNTEDEDRLGEVSCSEVRLIWE